MNQENHRRSHLTKEQRLPQSYKEVEKILNIVKRCEANVKTVLNNSKLRGAVLHKVSGLTFNVLKQRRLLDSIIERTQILEKEPNLRKELAGILIHELIFGNGLPGKSKPVETVLRHQVEIEKAYNDLKSDNSLFNNSLTYIPKYVRVNTLAITLPDVLEDLEYLGVKQIVFDANISEEEFYKLIKNLEKNTFLLDYHFKDLLVFNGEENLTTWSLYQKGHVFIQDKSSYIPAYVLAPPPGATVIDACAAPGMKTLHLTALMENNGVVYACERDQQRFEILNKMLKSGHANICQTFCGDFNSVDPRDEKYSSVEYILLDPSCSGSGMVNRMDYITDTKESKNDLRIQKLAGFQIILLKHALLFPSVKRVVYSTCSITETENEFVIHEVLNHFSHRFKLSPVLPDWSIRGSNNFEFGSHCLRAYPDKCFTIGFFVAMFERLEEYREQYPFEKTQHKHEKKKQFNGSGPKDSKCKNEVKLFDSNLKSKNQSVGEESMKDTTLDNTLTEIIEEEMLPIKKHKEKHKNDKIGHVGEKHIEIEAATPNNDMQNENFNSMEEVTKHQKKHKNKHDNLFAMPAPESETKDNIIQDIFDHDKDIQGGIFAHENDIQEINFKYKKKRKHKDFESNTNLDNIQIQEVQIQSIFDMDVATEVKFDKKKNKHKKDSYTCSFSDTQSPNVEENTLTETAPEIKILHQKKKHKQQHEKDSNSRFSEAQIKISNVDNDIFTETVQNVESSNKKKKKHKSKNEKKEDSNSSFHETQNLEAVIEISKVDNDIFRETVQNVESSNKKKKKHKNKYEKEDSNNSFCETQNPVALIEISGADNDIFTETVQNVESSNKKKKTRKSKHKQEDSNNSFCEIQNPAAQTEITNVDDNIFTETVQKVESSHKKKKKRKNKYENEDSNNSFCETQNPVALIEISDIDSDIFTETVQKVEFSHKKKKKHTKKNMK